jgi:hypothetical protein
MLMLKGKCLGVVEQSRGRGDNTWKQQVLGMQLVKNDSWQTEYVEEISLSKEQSSNGIVSELQKLKGKDLTIEIWASAYPRKSGAGINYHLVGILDQQADKSTG